MSTSAPSDNERTSNEGGLTMRTPDSVLTITEVAKDLRCSKAHVYKTINGLVPGVSPLPAISLGRRKLIRHSTLEQWKRANEHAAGDAMMIASLKNHAVDA